MRRLILLLLLLVLVAPGQLWAAKARPRGAQLNFKDVEVITTIKLMSRATGKSFIFNEKDLRGKKITILSSHRFTPKEALQVFESVLKLNDLVLVDKGKAMSILPFRTSTQTVAPLASSSNSRAGSLVTRVIMVENMDVTALRASLLPILSKVAVLSTINELNALVIRDMQSSAERFAEIVALLDQSKEKGQSWGPHIIPLKYAGAGDLTKLLNQLYSSPGVKAGKTLRIYPDARTNSLIVVGLPKMFRKLVTLVAKLDKKTEFEAGNIRVYKLRNAQADRVAKILGQFTKKLSASKSGQRTAGRPISQNRNTKITVMADEPSNSLVVFANQSDYDTIENVIEQLDVARPQVFLQALIMEVKVDEGLDLGVEWQASSLVGSGNSQALVTIGGVGNTGGPKPFPATPTGGATVGVIGGPITFGDQQFSSFNAFLKASQQNSAIDILSSPQILTLNNEESEIKVGEIIPTVGSTKIDANGNETTQIEYKEVGISLKLKPQINLDNTIELSIDETSSNLVEGRVSALNTQGAITTLNRALKTKVVVHDGQTIALGGLISDQKVKVVSKIPWLGDIPWLGQLFRSESIKKQKTNLMIFITPKIVRNQEELAQVSKETRLKLKDARDGRFRINVSKEYGIKDIAEEEMEEESTSPEDTLIAPMELDGVRRD